MSGSANFGPESEGGRVTVATNAKCTRTVDRISFGISNRQHLETLVAVVLGTFAKDVIGDAVVVQIKLIAPVRADGLIRGCVYNLRLGRFSHRQQTHTRGTGYDGIGIQTPLQRCGKCGGSPAGPTGWFHRMAPWRGPHCVMRPIESKAFGAGNSREPA